MGGMGLANRMAATVGWRCSVLKPLLLLLIVYFASCGSNGRNALPTVAFVKPATSISAVVGEPVAIEYVDGDPDDVASTEIVADVDVERQEQFAGAVLSGLALDPTNNRAHFADVLRADVYEVNLDTGERRLISGGDIGVGVALQRPESIAFDGRRNRLLVFESLNETSLRQAEPAGTLGRLC